MQVSRGCVFVLARQRFLEHPLAVSPKPSMSLLRKWLKGSPGRLINHTSELEASVIFDMVLTSMAKSLSWHLCPSLFSMHEIPLVIDTGIRIAKLLLSCMSCLTSFTLVDTVHSDVKGIKCHIFGQQLSLRYAIRRFPPLLD
jgi:hypothetical protein